MSNEVRIEIRVVIGDTIETTDDAIRQALRRCHEGEDPDVVFDELSGADRSDEDDSW